MAIIMNGRQQGLWAHIPAEGSDGQPFGSVIVELPQREEGALWVPELIGRILEIPKIWGGKSMKEVERQG